MTLHDVYVYLDCQANCKNRTCDTCYQIHDCDECPVGLIGRGKADEFMCLVAENIRIRAQNGNYDITVDELANIFSEMCDKEDSD